jgi:hypothetical protein
MTTWGDCAVCARRTSQPSELCSYGRYALSGGGGLIFNPSGGERDATGSPRGDRSGTVASCAIPYECLGVVEPGCAFCRLPCAGLMRSDFFSCRRPRARREHVARGGADDQRRVGGADSPPVQHRGLATRSASQHGAAGSRTRGAGCGAEELGVFFLLPPVSSSPRRTSASSSSSSALTGAKSLHGDDPKKVPPPRFAREQLLPETRRQESTVAAGKEDRFSAPYPRPRLRISQRFGNDPYRLVAHCIERQRDRHDGLVRATESEAAGDAPGPRPPPSR